MIEIEKYLDAIRSVSGVKNVGIVQTISCPEIVMSNEKDDEFKKAINDICQIVADTSLDLTLKSFMLKSTSHRIIMFREQKTLIFIYLEKSANYEILEKKVNEFLNDLLIYS